MKNFYRDGHVVPGGDGSGERSPTQQVAVPRTAAIDLSAVQHTYSLVKFNSYRKRGKAGSPPASTSNLYDVLKKVDWLVLFSPWYHINKAKRYTTLLLPTIFVSVFICFSGAAKAQSRQDVGAAEAVKPLQIGDTIPEELWNMPLLVVNHPDGKDTITLNDYRDKKLIILDFWATWCAPCVKGLPKLAELGLYFKDDLAIVLVSNEGASLVKSYLQKIGRVDHSIIDGTELSRKFAFRSIPHAVAIRNSEIIFSNPSNFVTKNSVAQMIEKDMVDLFSRPELRDYTPDIEIKNITSTIAKMGLNRSFFGFIDARLGLYYNEENYIKYVNGTIAEMLYNVHRHILPRYGRHNRILYQNLPSSKIDHFKVDNELLNSIPEGAPRAKWLYEWDKCNRYCYEFVDPDKRGITERVSIFGEDLKNFLTQKFRVEVRMEDLLLDCYVLSKKSGQSYQTPSSGSSNYHFDPITGQSIYHNMSLKHIASVIAEQNRYNSIPFVLDDTIDDQTYSITFNSALTDISAIQKTLERHGVELTKKKHLIKMLVVEDLPDLEDNERRSTI